MIRNAPHIFACCLLLAVAYGPATFDAGAQGLNVPASALTCSLRGPDSVRFVDIGYQPSSFPIEVTVHNTGTDDLAGVRVFILSSGRFTLISASSFSIDTLRAGESVSLSGDHTFHLQPIAADRSEIEALTVFVSADGVSTSCVLPVFVEKELRPALKLVCTAPEELRFDELLNDYVPNPFPVTTVLKNVGDGPALDCRIDYAGPPRVQPDNGIASIPAGRLEAGEEFRFEWNMRPGRRDAGGMDTLLFEALGAGGLGGRIVSTNCASDVHIPAARAADYICTLEVDTVQYDAVGGRYVPDPFMVRARVTNVGQGIAQGMRMVTILEDGLVLAPGQSLLDTVPGNLEPGQTAGPFVKSVRPLLRQSGDTLRITVLFTDRFGNSTRCEHRVWIPAGEPPMLSLACSSELDSLSLDPRTGSYSQAQFTLQAGISNTGDEAIYNVSLYAFPDPDGILIIDERNRERQITTALSREDGVRSVNWTVQCRASDIDRVVLLRILAIGRSATGQYLPLVHCDVPIFVPRVGQPRLQCALSTNVTNGVDDMTIAFDTMRADYEGTASSYGTHTVFRLSADIVNTGTAIAGPVAAALLLPPALQLEEGEPFTKTITPSELPIGGTGAVSWLVRPLHVRSDSTMTVELLVTASQAAPVRCTITLRLARSLDIVALSIPRDLTGVSGGVLEVPVLIGPSAPLEPAAYQLLLRFDPTLLRFIEARGEGTLTDINWRNLNARVLGERPFGTPSVLLVADSTRFTPNPRMGTVPLVRLRFEVIDRGGRPQEAGYIARTALEFIRYPSMMSDGRFVVPFVRPYDTSAGKTLTPVFTDGEATVSGDCILPLSASARLLPVHPNPFNPIVEIPFFFSEITTYRLVLLDGFGREIRFLEEGRREAGEYRLTFNAEGLPSGTYYCRLETPMGQQVQRMILLK